MLFAGLVIFGGLTAYFWLEGWVVLAVLPGVMVAILLYLIWGLATGRYKAN